MQRTIGNVTLDRTTFEISSPVGSFRLANKEFQMMEILMANPHHIISAERLMEKIWGFESEAEINSEKLRHIFDRFYRMDFSRNSETGGHGIGLSVAKAIVSAHGGKITARTKAGHYFQITATFPI